MTRSVLDANQVLSSAYDDSIGRLKVESTATIVGGSLDVVISDIDDSIKIGDGTGSRFIDPNTDGSVKTVQLLSKPFDSITRDDPDPSTTVEIYRSRVGGASGTVQEVLTITYRTASKADLVSIVRT